MLILPLLHTHSAVPLTDLLSIRAREREMAGVGEKMIVGALTGVMGPVLGKLSSLMEQEYFKLKGVRGRMVQLSQELIAINVALDKHAAMDSPDVHVKAWVKEIRELAYDIEDCIDLFVNHEPAGASGQAIGVKRLLRDSIGKLRGLHHRHKFADQIQDLKDVAADIYERKVKYKLDDCSSATTHEEIDPRLPWIFEEAEELVGMERRTEKFINQFVDYSTTARQSSVVSIFGPGGLGKTTLAYQVYLKIQGQFKCSALVAVSRMPDMNRILRDLFSQVRIWDWNSSDNDELIRSIGERQITDKLRKCLLDKSSSHRRASIAAAAQPSSSMPPAPVSAGSTIIPAGFVINY